MKTLSPGIDVSLTHGLDLVVMNERLQIEDVRKAEVSGLPEVIRQWHPSIIAIDSPPKFGVKGDSRWAERELNHRGIKIFYTPADAEKSGRPFYDWMRVGQKCFRIATEHGFEIFYGAGSMERRVIEVFPHASAVVMRGYRPPRGWQRQNSGKREWRLKPFEALGINTEKLRTIDHVDAALASLTGIYALRKDFVVVGSPSEGVIVLPTNKLLDRYSR